MKKSGPLNVSAARRSPGRLAWACLALLLGLAAPSGQGRDLPEYQVKAAFLFNFAAFVNWPEERFENAGIPLRYCVLQTDAVSRTLGRLIAGESLDGRPLELVRLDNGQDPAGCHILFSGSGSGVMSAAEQPLGVLTVGDSEEFLQQGGMIALLRKRNRIHPVINLDALEASPLRLSSKLLRLATRVRAGAGE